MNLPCGHVDTTFERFLQELLEDFRELAFERKAFTRGRKIKTSKQLLQVVMNYRGIDRVLRETAPDMPDMVADAALEATLITLLNNAAQAGVGEVEVSAGIEAGRIVFRVADRGPGLDADGKAAGWGVGLDLARAGLERLGGHLHVAGRPGGGVVARIDLPIPESRP